MTDPDDDPVRPVTSGLPLHTGRDGQAYLGCDTVAALLRAIAHTRRPSIP